MSNENKVLQKFFFMSSVNLFIYIPEDMLLYLDSFIHLHKLAGLYNWMFL